MSDWRKKAQQKAQERESKARQTREEEARKRELRERHASGRELAKKVAKLGRKFKCHVCGKLATEPRTTWEDDWDGVDFPGGRCGGSIRSTHTDWDEPGDLDRCNECGRYVCNDCNEAGLCRKCAEGGILWRWFRIS